MVDSKVAYSTKVTYLTRLQAMLYPQVANVLEPMRIKPLSLPRLFFEKWLRDELNLAKINGIKIYNFATLKIYQTNASEND